MNASRPRLTWEKTARGGRLGYGDRVILASIDKPEPGIGAVLYDYTRSQEIPPGFTTFRAGVLVAYDRFLAAGFDVEAVPDDLLLTLVES